MLTPQDIRDQKFEKATFGGYDMALVDDFLERLYEDYSMLYKESAVLKSKLKVLVEKVEEYRSTEDSMRMALLTAQKMGAEITAEAKKKGESLLAEAEEQAKERSNELRKEIAMEEARLAEAERKTSAFSKGILALIAHEKKFLESLGDLVIEVDVPVAPVAPVVPVAPSAPVGTPIVAVEPPVVVEASVAELNMEEMESSVGAYLAQEVSGMMSEAPLTGEVQTPGSFFDDAAVAAPAPATYAGEPAGERAEVEFYKLFDQDTETVGAEATITPMSILADAQAESVSGADETIDIARSISASLGDTEELKIDVENAFWDDEGQPTTTRPKFDFDNLQFGANYED